MAAFFDAPDLDISQKKRNFARKVTGQSGNPVSS